MADRDLTTRLDPAIEPVKAGFAARAAERIFRARRFLGALAVVMAILVAAGLLPPLGALIAFLAAGVLFAAVPLASANGAQAIGRGATNSPIEPATTRLAEALPDPCFLLDSHGIVLFANERARAAFPLRPGDVLTVRMRAPDLIAALGRVASGGKAEMVEFVERVPTERWFAAWFSPLSTSSDPAGRPAAIVLILDDFTERRQTDRVRVDFVANASHELRTPLASLAGFIDTLQGSAKEDPDARERFLAIMRDQATRMSRLIDDLLSLSRIELKAHVRPRDPVDLVSVLRHVVDALDPLARELGVVIESRLPAGPIIVPGDRDELVQVFENLLENACKYGQSGGRAIVSVTGPPGEKGECRVTIRDFGPGIPPEHVPRLTERFYRINADGSGRHRGTGLGLAIVKHIATRHRARLTIESRPGEGASFSVIFAEARLAPDLPAVEKDVTRSTS